jgi:uncharacterized protein (DUF58 family)
MIVPTSGLLIFYAITLPPLMLLLALGGEALWPAVAAGLLFIFIALLDAVSGSRRLRGIRVSLPSTVRMARDRASRLEISLTNTLMQQRTLRLGLPFPREISSSREDLLALLPKGVEHSRVAWPCTPLKRGQYPIRTCYLETRSPLGLWAIRGIREVECEIRVYPSLARERSSLAALFLNRGGFGIHARRQHGKGREFEKLREYIPGDGYDEIHWKATAKRRHPITKIFQIERTQEVYVIIDTSRLSARPLMATDGSDAHDGAVHGVKLSGLRTQGPGLLRGDGQAITLPHAQRGKPVEQANDSCLERFIAAALVVGLAAQKQGDLFGVLTFSDSVHDFLRARGGRPHYSACRERIYSLRPRMVNPDYEELSTFVRLKLRRRALIIVLTSLDDPLLAESFTRTMDLMGRHHLVMVTMLRPAGVRPIFSNSNLASLEEIYKELSGHALWHHLREIERHLSRHGVRFTLLDQERLCADLVTQYMNVKQRQLL